MDFVSVVTSEVKRPTADFHPTIWGDFFLFHAPLTKTVDASVQQELEGLKAEVRAMLMNVTHNPSKKLRLIDAIQSLGIAYHFETEIEDTLSEPMSDPDNIIEDDLHTVALRFRLLRQRGIKVSCDVFEKFKDSEGNFKDSLIDDVPGMLSLYEAAHLGIRGEEILDEALAFTITKLEAALAQLSPQIAEEVRHALKWPINKSIRRLEAKYYMTSYSRDGSQNETLLKFAKLDFNILQELHKKELHAMTEWWKSLEVKEKLPYARDRIVEVYLWMLPVYFEPMYSVGRIILTKITCMISLLDDTYDNYGTIIELQLFTEVIQRWDIKAIDGLPECMKIVYRTLIDVFSEIEMLMEKEGRSYCLHYAKQAMKDLVQAYCDEAKWRDEGYVPTLEEYINVSQISAALLMIATASFLGIGPIATKEAFEWLFCKPKIVRALSIIGRLEDDIVSHKFEQKRNHVASAVECYMNQHHVSEEEAVEVLREEIANAWKDMNEERLKPTAVPMPLLERIFSLAQAMDFVYKDGDGYTENHLLKEHIALLFVDPVPV